MTNHKGTRTPDQGNTEYFFIPKIYIFFSKGAETPIYLALLPPNTSEPKGKFIGDKQVFDWENTTPTV